MHPIAQFILIFVGEIIVACWGLAYIGMKYGSNNKKNKKDNK